MDQQPNNPTLDKRLELQALLEEIMGNKNVYFQPPSSVSLAYPCIVYSRTSPRDRFANNDRYLSKDRYSLTVIDRDPDSNIPVNVLKLPMSSLERSFIADSLNHTVIQLYI